MFGHFWERFRAFLHFLKNFDLFENFRRLDPPWNTGQKKKFSKKLPKTCPKHVWTLLGTISDIFAIFKKNLTFLKISEDSTLHGTMGKKFFEKSPQNMFKTRLDTFGDGFGHF